MKQSIVPFIQTQRQEQLFTIQILIICLIQSMVQLWQKYKNIRQKAWVRLLIQWQNKTLTFQNTNLEVAAAILNCKI